MKQGLVCGACGTSFLKKTNQKLMGCSDNCKKWLRYSNQYNASNEGKICSICEKWLSLDSFGIHVKARDQRQRKCKKCRRNEIYYDPMSPDPDSFFKKCQGNCGQWKSGTEFYGLTLKRGQKVRRNKPYDGLRAACKKCLIQLKVTDNTERRCPECQGVKKNRNFWSPDSLCRQCVGPRSLRDKRLISMYGIDETYFNRLLKEQHNSCAICFFSFDDTGVHVDHCHDVDIDLVFGRNRVRGLLCLNCNAALGMFGDDSNRLHRAAEYVNGKAMVS